LSPIEVCLLEQIEILQPPNPPEPDPVAKILAQPDPNVRTTQSGCRINPPYRLIETMFSPIGNQMSQVSNAYRNPKHKIDPCLNQQFLKGLKCNHVVESIQSNEVLQ
jgi:hypothetical protein